MMLMNQFVVKYTHSYALLDPLGYIMNCIVYANESILTTTIKNTLYPFHFSLYIQTVHMYYDRMGSNT